MPFRKKMIIKKSPKVGVEKSHYSASFEIRDKKKCVKTAFNYQKTGTLLEKKLKMFPKRVFNYHKNRTLLSQKFRLAK